MAGAECLIFFVSFIFKPLIPRSLRGDTGSPCKVSPLLTSLSYIHLHSMPTFRVFFLVRLAIVIRVEKKIKSSPGLSNELLTTPGGAAAGGASGRSSIGRAALGVMNGEGGGDHSHDIPLAGVRCPRLYHGSRDVQLHL